ncbi:hypothetical protein OAE12_01255, partial [bacterium]|nr:hypothetical protein [bacterium]
LFLASIFLLLTNDLYLKYEYHNYLTGKLSDFAGLFAFPYFFSCFFPKKTKQIYVFSGVLFIIWKSEFSQPIFDFAHSYGIGIDRTVDYSDLISLLIIPVSYIYWKTDFKQIFRPNKIFKPIIVSICCFAFVATSVPSKNGTINIKSDYEVNIKTSLDKAEKLDLYYLSFKDGKYFSKLNIPEKKAEINISLIIEEKENGILNIKLDSILDYRVDGSTMIFVGGVDEEDVDYVENLSQSDFEVLFIEQKIKALREE